MGYTFEEKKRDARTSGDPFLQRGDTLYLLYDLTDSLQMRTGEGVEWWQRFLTKEEIAIVEDPSNEDMFDLGEPDMFLVRRWKLSPKKELSSEEIRELTLTTRDEVIAFYEREVKRMAERKAKEEAEEAEYSNRFKTVVGEQKWRDALTEKAVYAEFKTALQDETNKGKGDKDILAALTQDKEYFAKDPARVPAFSRGTGFAGGEVDDAAVRAAMGLSPKKD